MATIFPFNQLPNIIPQIQEPLFTTITDLQSKLFIEVNNLQNSILSSSPNVNCNDAEIAHIRNQIERINQLIANVDPILSFIPSLVNTLRTISTAAQIISSVQLAIVIPTPAAPVSQLISAAAETLQRINNLIETLSELLSSFSSVFNNVSSVMSLADNLFLNVCGKLSNFDGFGNLPNSPELDIQVGLSLDDLANLYPSTFYREVNVTDEDINQRLQLISDLLDRGLSISERLNDAPSEILSGNIDPTSDVGKTGDYFINTITGVIFGPKPTDSSWI